MNNEFQHESNSEPDNFQNRNDGIEQYGKADIENSINAYAQLFATGDVDRIFKLVKIYEQQIPKDACPEDVVEAVHKYIDEQSQAVVEQMPVSCKAGCSHCCHYKVFLTAAETKLILAYCEHNSIIIDLGYLEKQSAVINADQYRLSGYSQCVFLKDNKCSIYQVRPAACRKYMVTNPPERCDDKNVP